jgi:hypothetical protein
MYTILESDSIKNHTIKKISKDITEDIENKKYIGEKLPVDKQLGIKEGKALVPSLIENQMYVPCEIVDSKQNEIWNVERLEQIGFTEKELEEIQKKLLNLLERYGLIFHLIIWPTAANLFDDIKNTIDENIDVIRSEKIKISRFDEFIRQIYTSHINKKSWQIERKIQEMPNNTREILHIKVNPPKKKHSDESNYVRKIKEMVRNQYASKMNPNYKLELIHSTDTYQDNRNVAEIIKNHRDATGTN